MNIVMKATFNQKPGNHIRQTKLDQRNKIISYQAYEKHNKQQTNKQHINTETGLNHLRNGVLAGRLSTQQAKSLAEKVLDFSGTLQYREIKLVICLTKAAELLDGYQSRHNEANEKSLNCVTSDVMGSSRSQDTEVEISFLNDPFKQLESHQPFNASFIYN
jgi:hypothetical protein